MTSRPHLLTLEHLLSHRTWLRSLAATLVASSDADDIVQDTYLAAIERPPRHDHNLRGWLARTCRRLASRHERSMHRRTQRERRRSPVENAPSSDHLAERLEIERALVSALTHLAEPHRTVVLMRYFDGLEPRVIAQQLERPVATVKSQLHRGLIALRSELETSLGKDGTWRERLMLLVPSDALRAITVTAEGLSTVKMMLGLPLALGLVALGVWFARNAFVSSNAISSPNAVRPDAVHARDTTPDAVSSTHVARAVVEDEERHANTTSSASDRDLLVQVLGASGNPLDDVPIIMCLQTELAGEQRFETDHHQFTAGPGEPKGIVRIGRDELRRMLNCLDDVHVTSITRRCVAVRPAVRLSQIEPWTTEKDVVPEHPIQFQLPPSGRLHVTVRAELDDSVTLDDLAVFLSISQGSRDSDGKLDFRSPEGYAEPVHGGRATFFDIPLEHALHVQLRDSRHRYRSVERTFPPFTFDGETRTADLVLTETYPVLRGRLIDEDGRPVSLVTVDAWACTDRTRFGYATFDTDRDGHFECVAVDDGWRERYTFLEFVQRADPKRLPRPDDELPLATGRMWNRSLPRTGLVDVGDIVLRVARRVRKPNLVLIAGIVQDTSGRPLRRAYVWAYGSDSDRSTAPNPSTADAQPSGPSSIAASRTRRDASGSSRTNFRGTCSSKRASRITSPHALRTRNPARRTCASPCSAVPHSSARSGSMRSWTPRRSW